MQAHVDDPDPVAETGADETRPQSVPVPAPPAADQPALPREQPPAAEQEASPQPEHDPAPPAEGAPPGVPGLPVPGLPDPEAAEDDGGDPGEVSFDPEDLYDLRKAETAEEPGIRPGSRCKGVIVAVGDTGVIVSFGTKVEGRVPTEEFRDAEGRIGAEVGQEIEVIVQRRGAPGSYASLSYRRAMESVAWRQIETSHARNLPLQARVLERVKGGLRVDIGVAAFLPGSQVDIRPVPDLDAWVGRDLEVVVVEFNRRRSNAVVSRSELLKAQRREQQRETLSQLAVGQPATGVVKNLTSYGAFVDLGGIDGLIKLTELSYGRVGKPSEILQPGQEVTAKVMRIDPARERVGLSLKAMRPDPWLTVGERYQTGSRVVGRVASVQDYGAFIELESGVEGLIHVSEIAWSRHPKHPSKTFEVGTETEAVVLGVKPKDRRISLSFKRLTPDPWDQYGESLEIGQVVQGVVRRIADYGLFVEIVEGIEGLVHVSDLSWDSRTKNPRSVARKGQQINTVILHVDTESRRLSLGIKQLEPDAWDTFFSEYGAGYTLPGLVRRVVKFGAFVELAPGVEGLCHNSQAPRGRDGLRPGSRYNFTILDVNEGARRIGLRCASAVPIDDDAGASA